MTFKTIVVDPPWMYKITETGGSMTSGAAQKYDVLSFGELARLRLPISHIVDDDCHLLMWTTVPMLDNAILLMREWGFIYKTALFWEKVKTFGLGYWFRNQIEMVLVGNTGDAPAFHSQEKNLFSIFKEKPTGHSEKPEQFYKLIEPLTKPPRLEIFARRQRPGWTCIGNEIDGKDIRDSLGDLATMESP